jgi:uncharacterized protein YjbJ (UPF0337 family)
MLNQEQIKGKWDEIKGGVKNLWGKVTDDDLEKIKGNIQSVSGIVEEKYGESKESIAKKLDNLMDSFDNDTDKSLKLNDGESSYERNPTGIKTSGHSQYEDEAEDINTRSEERSKFEVSEGGAINTKQGIAGNKDNQPYPGGTGAGLSAGAGTAAGKKSNFPDVDDVDASEIYDENKKPGPDAEDRVARH